MVQDNTAELPEGTDTIIEGASGDSATLNTTLVEDGPVPRKTASDNGIADRLRAGGEKLSSQAGERARGLVGQGLERSSEALANVAKLVGETAPGIEERLGAEYGDYARRAASAIENAANKIAEKDADELIDDTREFVRNSPGIALAGAAVVGFVVARLLKTGLARDEDDDED
jgi:ElaB/YqjD/DUF883 family membrane-anchored ribosome-binding protein